MFRHRKSQLGPGQSEQVQKAKEAKKGAPGCFRNVVFMILAALAWLGINAILPSHGQTPAVPTVATVILTAPPAKASPAPTLAQRLTPVPTLAQRSTTAPTPAPRAGPSPTIKR